MAEKESKGIRKFFEEFKAFAMRGNVLDMAVGVVVGSAFTAIVNSLVGDIISPLIGLFFNADFSDVVIQIGDVGIGIGSDIRFHLRTNMHDFRIFVDHHIFCYIHGTKFCDTSQIISSQVHEHIVLRQFFFITEKVFDKGFIFRFVFSSRSGSCNRECR